tara:strand:- start:49 stop:360 length:312 start_codon:yes stop_codon:yes gene_type:complete
MNRFLLLVLTGGLLSSCSYGSFYEANEACRKWKEEGGTYSYKTPYLYEKGTRIIEDVDIRKCWDEERTNQVLGSEDISKSKHALYQLGMRPEKNEQVIKRFKY